MEERISVVVPAYNAEEYLEKCIHSISCQTYRNIEIIIIDDGSTDDTWTICNNLSEQDDRIIVTHQDNAGVSAARNRGIDIATGSYILFVDADDYINEEYCSTLLSIYNNNDCQLAVIGIQVEDANGIVIETSPVYKKLFTQSEFYKEIFHDKGIKGYPVCKLYSRDIIIKNGIRFDADISVMEDVLFNALYLNHCNGVYVDTCYKMYHYIRNMQSVMQSTYKTEKFDDRALTAVISFDRCIESIGCESGIRYAKARRSLMAANCVRRLYFDGRREEIDRYELRKKIRKGLIFAFIYGMGDAKWRLSSMICMISPRLDYLLRKMIG